MKITIRVFLIFIAVSVSFCACKKGENDPFLSLKSRTARLQGDWQLTGGQIIIMQGDDTLEEHIYYEDSESVSYHGGIHSLLPYSETITFDKKGTYKLSIKKDISIDEEGSWMWLDKCKEEKQKNKEAIGLYRKHTLYSNGTEYFYSGFTNANVWTLDELRSKKLVVRVNTSTILSGYSTTLESGTYIYEKM